MKKLILAAIALASVAIAVPSQAAVVYNYNDGLLYGNICQTPYGWQMIPWTPVSWSCYSPAWNSYGYVANR